jgi:RNA polymerase sigma-70 factor, ECF subfamily
MTQRPTAQSLNAPLDPESERALVARVRDGDVAAFTLIVDRYVPALLAFATERLRSRPDAEEIVQDVFALIWANRVQWAITVPLRTYLYQSVRNRIANWYRDTSVHQSIFTQSGKGPPEQRAPIGTDDPLKEDELKSSLRAALDRLPDRCREVFLLSREHGLTYPEIATVLGITTKTVERHMTRALCALRLALKDWTSNE